MKKHVDIFLDKIYFWDGNTLVMEVLLDNIEIDIGKIITIGIDETKVWWYTDYACKEKERALQMAVDKLYAKIVRKIKKDKEYDNGK